MKDRKYWDKAIFETIDLSHRAVIVKGLGETRHTRQYELSFVDYT